MNNLKRDMLKRKNVVSVIVPVYNIEAYLEQCLESIINQTYKDLEIVLIDDGSEDESGKICDSYADLDSRIKVYHQENHGLARARKAGVEHATGEFCLHVDGDDWLELDAIEVLINAMAVSKSDVVQMSWRENEQGRIHDHEIFAIDCDGAERISVVEAWMNDASPIDSAVVSKMYKTALFREVYKNVDDNNSLGEDQIFFLYLMRDVKKIKSVNNVLYHYRIRSGSLCHGDDRVTYSIKDEQVNMLLYQLLCLLYPEISEEKKSMFYYNRKMQNLSYGLKPRNIHIPFYCFPRMKELLGKKVVMYGAGIVGKDYVSYISSYEDVQIVVWVDKNYKNYNYPFRKVLPVEALKETEFDYVIVAILDKDVAKSVRDELVETYHIEPEKILWDYDRNCNVLTVND